MTEMTDVDRLYARVAVLYPDAGLLDSRCSCEVLVETGHGSIHEYDPNCSRCHGTGTLLPPPEVRLGRLVRVAQKAFCSNWSRPHRYWWLAPIPESALAQALIATIDYEARFPLLCQQPGMESLRDECPGPYPYLGGETVAEKAQPQLGDGKWIRVEVPLHEWNDLQAANQRLTAAAQQACKVLEQVHRHWEHDDAGLDLSDLEGEIAMLRKVLLEVADAQG